MEPDQTGGLLLSSLLGGWVTRAYNSPWVDVTLSGIDAAVVCIFAAMHRRQIGALLKTPSLDRRGSLALLGIAVGTVLLLSAYFALIERAGVPIMHMSRIYVKFGWPLWSIFLLGSVMPAVFEELAFRGVIQSCLELVLNAREALLIQAALFSVLHLMPMIFPSHFFMGLAFGLMRNRSRSLYPGMLLHASWNALVLFEELYRV